MKKTDNRVNNISEIPEFIFPLFWEYKPETIDIVKHARLIMGRIMERGTWDSMLWLRKTYSQKRLVSFLEERGRDVLSPREFNYWALIAEMPAEKRKKWVKESRENRHVWGARHVR